MIGPRNYISRSQQLCCALALALAAPATAQDRVERVESPLVRVQLDAMPLGALTSLLMRDIMRVPYVISADVLGDQRPVSVNLAMKRADVPVDVVRFLRSVGLVVELRGGTVYVTKAGAGPVMGAANFGDNTALSPNYAASSPGPAGPMPKPVPDVIAVVTPAYRSVIELSDLIEPALPGVTMSAREGSEPKGAEIADKFEPDRLVLAGTKETVGLAVGLAKLLDKPRPVVQLRGVVFEVRSSSSSRSALSLLASIGGLQVGSQPSGPQGEQFVRIATGGLNAVLSATKGDGRFKVVAEPSLAALSGSPASINSGSDVPTIGATTFTEDGSPVRSVVYRPSGISLTVTPIVRAGEIELTVSQERSSFAKTTTGVDDSPTLNTSKASSKVAIAPGETIAIAGLDLRSSSSSRSGFLGGLLGGRSKDADEGQLLLVIQADIITQQRQGATSVVYVKATGDGEVSPSKGGVPAAPARKRGSTPADSAPTSPVPAKEN